MSDQSTDSTLLKKRKAVLAVASLLVGGTWGYAFIYNLSRDTELIVLIIALLLAIMLIIPALLLLAVKTSQRIKTLAMIILYTAGAAIVISLASGRFGGIGNFVVTALAVYLLYGTPAKTTQD